jgi:beta-xylosidase
MNELKSRISKTNRIGLILLMTFLHVPVNGQVWKADNGDGTYHNPVIFGDFSDPDVIRTGDDFYMVASSFTCQPGIPVLHSKDLVNWTIINYVYTSLPFGRYHKPAHGRGSWAPSIRYHKGLYYVYFCTPDEGLFMARTANPSKKWELVHVQDIAQWEDPCPFWDDDGNAYLVHSKLCGGPAILHRMAEDGTKLLDNGKIIYEDSVKNPILEGLKFLKKDGYYYLFAPAGGVEKGWQTVLRSANVFGPYESKMILHEGNGINGPHQGGFIDTPDGEWWFIHFQDKGVYGRIIHLQPGGWKQEWPYLGLDINGDGIGEPVLVYKKPFIKGIFAHEEIQTSDEFNDSCLGLQWQWQAAPDSTWYSLTARPGFLRLYAYPSPTEYGNLYYTPNLLLQKLMAPSFAAVTKFTLAGTLDGESAGMTVFGNYYSFICLQKTTEGNRVSLFESGFENCGFNPVEKYRDNVKEQTVWLKVTIYDNGTYIYAYSLDGSNYTSIDHISKLYAGGWIGAKIGIFCINPNIPKGTGYADFDFFRIEK